MQQRMMALESAYEKLRQALNKITGEPSQDLINETVECCLRPIERVKNRYFNRERVYIVIRETVKWCLRPIDRVKKQVYREGL